MKSLLKDKKISEDENKKYEKEIQTLTDNETKKIDDKTYQKEKEIMKIWTQLNMLPLLWMAMEDGE